jgi:hypothetical protein
MARFSFTFSELMAKTLKFGALIVAFLLGTTAVVMFGWLAVTPKEALTTSPSQPSTLSLQPAVNAQSIERPSGPQIVQSSAVTFPVSGEVIVQSIEEDGEFPQMLFTSKRTGQKLLRSTIVDSDKFLKHEHDSPDGFPQLRFRSVNGSSQTGPIIMSVGIYHGGSDSGYYLTLFAERNGHLVRLNNKTISNAIQGGYYFGNLNKKLGDGLAVWSFIWGQGLMEAHYSDHHYLIEIYRISGDRLVLSRRYKTKRMYESDKNSASLLELGIHATDQRLGIPEIKETLDL